MYELDGVTYSQEDLEAAAVKYKMDYKDYLSTMQAKGLKDAGSNTDTEYEALKKAGADNEFLKIGKTRDDSYKELEKAQEYNYITIGGQTVTENEYMNEYAGGEIGVSSNVGQASDKKEKLKNAFGRDFVQESKGTYPLTFEEYAKSHNTPILTAIESQDAVMLTSTNKFPAGDNSSKAHDSRRRNYQAIKGKAVANEIITATSAMNVGNSGAFAVQSLADTMGEIYNPVTFLTAEQEEKAIRENLGEEIYKAYITSRKELYGEQIEARDERKKKDAAGGGGSLDYGGIYDERNYDGMRELGNHQFMRDFDNEDAEIRRMNLNIFKNIDYSSFSDENKSKFLYLRQESATEGIINANVGSTRAFDNADQLTPFLPIIDESSRDKFGKTPNEQIKIDNDIIQEEWIKANMNNAGIGPLTSTSEYREAINGEKFKLKPYLDTKQEENFLDNSVAFLNQAEKQIVTKNAELELAQQPFNEAFELLEAQQTALGEVNENSTQSLLDKYNSIQDQKTKLLKEYKSSDAAKDIIKLKAQVNAYEFAAESYNEKNAIFQSIKIAEQAMQLNYNLVDRMVAKLEVDFVAPLAFVASEVIGQTINLGEFLDLEENPIVPNLLSLVYPEAENIEEGYGDIVRSTGINYYKAVTEDFEANFPKSLKFEEDVLGDGYTSFGDYTLSALADSAFTIAAVLTPSGIARQGAKTVASNYISKLAANKATNVVKNRLRRKITNKALKNATNVTMAAFFVSSGGSKGATSEIEFRLAPDKIKELNALLEKTNDPISKREIQRQLDYWENVATSSQFQRTFNAVLYGGIEMVAEKIGTLSYINKAKKVAQAHRAAGTLEKFKYNLRKAKIRGFEQVKNVGIELAEENITAIGHNLVDIIVLGENKSIFDGMDIDLQLNTAIASLALQGPGGVTNIYNAVKNELQTQTERKEARTILEKILVLEKDINNGKANSKLFTKDEIKSKKDEIEALKDKARINDFLTLQKWSKMTMDEKKLVMEKGAALRKAERELFEMANNPQLGQEGFEKEYSAREAHVKKLRDEIGVVLDSKSFKEYQKLANDPKYNGIIKQNVRIGYARNQVMEVAIDLAKEQFDGETIVLENESDLEIWLLENEGKVDLGLWTKFSENAGWVSKDRQTIVINQNSIQVANMLAGTSSTQALINSITPLHELTHQEINSKKVFTRGKDSKRKAKLAAEGMKGVLLDKLNSGELSESRYNEIIKRIDTVDKANYFDEILTTFSESLILGEISSSDAAFLYGMKSFLSNMFSTIAPKISDIFDPFATTAGMYQFLSTFVEKQTQLSQQTVAIPEEEKEESASVQGSKIAIGNQINNIVGDITGLTKQEFKMNAGVKLYNQLISEDAPSSTKQLLENVIRGQLIKNNVDVVKGEIYNQPLEKFYEDVKFQLYDKTINRFDPAVNNDAGGFIVSELVNFRIGDISNKYKNDPKAKADSIEKVTGGLTMAETIASDEINQEDLTDISLAKDRETRAAKDTKQETPDRSVSRQSFKNIETISKDITPKIKNKISSIVEDAINSSKNITSSEIVKNIEKEVIKLISKDLGKIGEKGGEIVVPQEYKDFINNEYFDIIKSIPVDVIKKSYSELFSIKELLREKDKKVNPDTGKITYPGKGIFEINRPKKSELLDYFTKPKDNTKGAKNTLIARQKQLYSLIAKEIIKDEVSAELADRKVVEKLAKKLNVAPQSIVIEGLINQIDGVLDIEKLEQKSFDKFQFSKITGNINKLSGEQLLEYYAGLKDFLVDLKSQNEFGKLNIEKAWIKAYGNDFLTNKKGLNTKAKKDIIESFDKLLEYYTRNYKTFDSEKVSNINQNISEYLYDNIFEGNNLGTVKGSLGLLKGSINFKNEQQVADFTTAMANVIQALNLKGDFQAALDLSAMLNNTLNTTGKISAGNFSRTGKKTDKYGIKEIEATGEKGSLRYSIFEGNTSYINDFLKPLFPGVDFTIGTKKGEGKINKELGQSGQILYKLKGEKDYKVLTAKIIPQSVKHYANEIVETSGVSEANLEKSSEYATLNQEALFLIADSFKDQEKNATALIDPETKKVLETLEEAKAKVRNSFGMFLMSANSDMGALIRAAARLDSVATNLDPAFIKKYKKAKPQKEKDKLALEYLRYEHNPPARLVQVALAEYFKDGFSKDQMQNVFDDYGVSIIPKTMDDQIGIFNADTMPGIYEFGVKDGVSKWVRYFNSKMYGAFNNSIKFYEKTNKGFKETIIAPNQPDAFIEVQEARKNNNDLLPKQIQASKLETNFEALEGLEDLSEAIARARLIDAPEKGISVWDFDDTLAQTKSNVLYTLPDGTKGKIDATQYAVNSLNLEAQGATFDFSEFNKVMKGTKGPMFEKAVARNKKFGNKNVFILTARPQQAAPAIHKFLKGIGLNIPIENITGLENGTPQAKANWITSKAAEGYNNFYFADDAYKNVKAVQDILDIIDVKSKVQQAKVQASKLSGEFNGMIERVTGIGAKKVYSKAKAEVVGARKRDDIFIGANAEDFTGLLYKVLGKGKQGNQDLKFLKRTLLDPFGRAMNALDADRITLMADFIALKKQLKLTPKGLRKEVPGEGFTKEQAVRVWIWNEQGIDVPGLSKADTKSLLDFVNNDTNLISFAQELIAINKKDGYAKPSKFWLSGTITTDLIDGLNGVKRNKYLEEWQQNVDIIFSEANLNKLEAAFGTKYRGALEHILRRMKTGRNLNNSDKQISKFTEWINGSIGTIMFFNTRSALLQTLSSVNFINFGDNNLLKASKAFANQKQFWKDFMFLMNSDFLVNRRSGLKLTVNDADIAAMAEAGGIKGVVSGLLKAGYLPTQIMDSFAISSGGSTFFRNRANSYIKQGLSKSEAEAKAFEDFREIAEETQQSSRPDRISKEQSGELGRIILAFANTPSQYARLMKKAALDLKNGRGDWKTNVSKMVYYGFVQNLVFNMLQNAMFAVGFGDDDEDNDKKTEAKLTRTANGMVDSILRGTGVKGAVFATIKNTLLEIYEQYNKKSPEYVDVVFEATTLSPPISSKLKKLRSAARSFQWNKKEIAAKGLSLDNPALLAYAQILSATANIPLDRAIKKVTNLVDATNSEAELLQSIALIGGWSAWEINLDKPDWQKEPETVPFPSKQKNIRQKSNNKKTVKQKKVKQKN